MIDIKNIPNGALPPEVADAFAQFLDVQGRIKFPLKPTTASAVSTASDDDSGINDTKSEIDDLINSVAELEDIVEQLEDMADQLTKDMNIPPADNSIAKAVNRLGGNQNITQDIFNKAQAIMTYGPVMVQGQHPVIAALTGDGHLEGPWLDCSAVTQGLGKIIKVNPSSKTIPEDVIENKTDEITRDFEKNLAAMLLHILLMLWWNMIWPKFLVDLVIIDPLRLMIANPLDGLIGFFKAKKLFRIKDKNWVLTNGKINKALTQFRKYLLCKVPYMLWGTADKDYDPIVEINCPGDADYTCPEKLSDSDPSGSGNKEVINPKGNISEMGKAVEAQDGPGDSNEGDICGNPSEYGKDAPKKEPSGLGMSPECLAAAVTIIRAVENKVYTPNKPGPNDPTLQTNLGKQIEQNFRI